MKKGVVVCDENFKTRKSLPWGITLSHRSAVPSLRFPAVPWTFLELCQANFERRKLFSHWLLNLTSSVIGLSRNLSQSQPSIFNFKQFAKSNFLQARYTPTSVGEQCVLTKRIVDLACFAGIFWGCTQTIFLGLYTYNSRTICKNCVHCTQQKHVLHTFYKSLWNCMHTIFLELCVCNPDNATPEKFVLHTILERFCASVLKQLHAYNCNNTHAGYKWHLHVALPACGRTVKFWGCSSCCRPV